MMLLNLRAHSSQQPLPLTHTRTAALPLLTCTGGAWHDECTTSSTLRPIVMSPSLRVTLDSSDHMTFFRSSGVQSYCASFHPPHWWVVFLQTKQLFSPDCWVPFALCIWTCSKLHCNSSSLRLPPFYSLRRPVRGGHVVWPIAPNFLWEWWKYTGGKENCMQ